MWNVAADVSEGEPEAQTLAIRFANSDEDAAFLAPKLRTSKEFLQKLKRGRFAAYVRDMTDSAVAISVPKTNFAKVSLPTHTTKALGAPEEPIVGFNPRPAEMEPWRLDNAYRPKSDPQSPPAPTRPAAGAGQKSKPTGITEPPKSEPSPAGDDPHTGDHTDPAPEWGDK